MSVIFQGTVTLRLVNVFMALLLSIGSVAFADEFTGNVVGVTDGDTIEVMRDGKAIRVRLNGIDCPESNQPFGSRAKQFTSGQVFNKDVRIVIRDTDRYGRTVGDVYLSNGKRLNELIVSAGLAWWYVQYAPNDSALKLAESKAKDAKIGLWGDPNPIPPWEFRNGSASTSRPSPRVQSPPAPSGDDSSDTGTVYVTRTGKKYHAQGCRYLSGGAIPKSLSDAKTAGYTACSVCRPFNSGLASAEEKTAVEIIGKWHDNGGLNPGVFDMWITILKKADGFHCEEVFKGGNKRDYKLERNESGGVVRYVDLESSHGDYYVIEEQTGDLKICDSDGYIRTAKRIKESAAQK